MMTIDRDIGKIGEPPRRRLLLPAAHQIWAVRLGLLLDLQFARIFHRRVVGDRDVGDAPGARLVVVEDRVLERRPARLDRDDRP